MNQVDKEGATRKAWSSLLVFFLLSLASVGTSLFLAAAPIYLRSIGLSTAESALLVASTTFPNIFLGASLGRFVDQGSRRSLFLRLSVGLAATELSLMFLVPLARPSLSFWVAAVNMQAAAFLFSALGTLTYQYLIPSLDVDETRAFAKWEVAAAIASVTAAVISLTLLARHSVTVLILIDAVTLLISGTAVFVFWPPGANTEALPIQARPYRTAFEIVRSDPVLLGAAVAMIGVAFCIHSLEANIALISYDSLQLSEALSVTFAAALGAVSGASALMLTKYHAFVTRKLHLGQRWCINSYIVIAASLVLSLYKQLPFVAVTAMLAIAVIEPVWAVVNTRLVRSRIHDGRYGELYGLIRMPRALLTFAGATLVGYSQEMGVLWVFAAASTLLLFGLRSLLRYLS